MYSFSAATKSPRSHASFAASSAFDAATLAAFAAWALPSSRETSPDRHTPGDGGRRARVVEASTVSAIDATMHSVRIDRPLIVDGRRSSPLRLYSRCLYRSRAADTGTADASAWFRRWS